MKIGLFGGTFDPIHSGHIGLAESIISQKLLDRIIFIPAASPPHKPKAPVTPFLHRANMVRLAVKGKSYFKVSEIEEERLPLPSYTYDTVKWFSINNPDDRFYLIIGEDSLMQIHTWYMGKELIELCDIITYPRESEHIALDKLAEYWPKKTAEKLFKTILPLPKYNISATEIRKSVREKEKLKSLIPSLVYDYIERHGLYGRT